MDKEPKKIKLTGDRWTFLVLTLVSMCITMCAQCEIEKEKNDILRQQLEQSKRQYALDSLQFYSKQK